RPASRRGAGFDRWHSCRLPLVALPRRAGAARRGCGIRSRFRLQIGTIPGNDNMGAAFDEVVEGQFGAAAFKEALRDEDAEPHVVLGAGAGREIGLAEPPQQMRRETGAIVGDLDADHVAVPMGGDAYLAASE